MRIVHISDTHNRHRELEGKLPEGDMIVHSGDFTFAGSEQEAFDFLNWFCDLPYRYKVCIAGNHDGCMDGADGIEGLPEDVYYLNHAGVTIEGLKIYGLPMLMSEVMSGKDVEYIDEIPEDTDILVTHQPPFRVLDFADGRHYGSRALWEQVQRIEPQMHLFGHIHDAYGVVKTGHTVYVNSAVVDGGYALAFKPHVFEVNSDYIK